MSTSKYISSQATIVITVMPDKTVCIRADNNGRSDAATLADAISRLARDVMSADLKDASSLPRQAAAERAPAEPRTPAATETGGDRA